jgi:hypothetical protein
MARAKVRSLRQGIEAEISLVLDVMLPAARVIDALKAFRAEFPMVSLRLYVEALGAVTQIADLARRFRARFVEQPVKAQPGESLPPSAHPVQIYPQPCGNGGAQAVGSQQDNARSQR